jgi:hypothetical protein
VGVDEPLLERRADADEEHDGTPARDLGEPRGVACSVAEAIADGPDFDPVACRKRLARASGDAWGSTEQRHRDASDRELDQQLGHEIGPVEVRGERATEQARGDPQAGAIGQREISSADRGVELRVLVREVQRVRVQKIDASGRTSARECDDPIDRLARVEGVQRHTQHRHARAISARRAPGRERLR